MLEEGRTGRWPVVFDVGSVRFGLDETLFVSAELVGGSIAVRLAAEAELVAYTLCER